MAGRSVTLSPFSWKILVYNKQVLTQGLAHTGSDSLWVLHDETWYNGSDNEHPKDISDYHLLTQDFIYAIGVHFVDFDKLPAYFTEEDAQLCTS